MMYRGGNSPLITSDDQTTRRMLDPPDPRGDRKAATSYTITFSTSMSSLSTPITSPPVTSRIRNLGGVSTCPSHSPSRE